MSPGCMLAGGLSRYSAACTLRCRAAMSAKLIIRAGAGRAKRSPSTARCRGAVPDPAVRASGRGSGVCRTCWLAGHRVLLALVCWPLAALREGGVVFQTRTVLVIFSGAPSGPLM